MFLDNSVKLIKKLKIQTLLDWDSPKTFQIVSNNTKTESDSFHKYVSWT